MGVTYTPIRYTPFGHHLNFGDPDNLPLELHVPNDVARQGHEPLQREDGGSIGGLLAVSGDVVIVVVDRATIDQGLGERWRYHWSVLHDRLSLVSEPGEAMQKGRRRW